MLQARTKGIASGVNSIATEQQAMRDEKAFHRTLLPMVDYLGLEYPKKYIKAFFGTFFLTDK